MKTPIIIFVIFLVIVILSMWYESTIDPYKPGAHWDYSIHCENGFVYKKLENRQGIIQVFNSDGTPLKCGEKIY